MMKTKKNNQAPLDKHKENNSNKIILRINKHVTVTIECKLSRCFFFYSVIFDKNFKFFINTSRPLDRKDRCNDKRLFM